MQGMYTLWDAKAEAFSMPFFADTDNLAVRIFGDSVLKPGTVLNDHPEDFFLYKVGSWEQSSGKVRGCNPVSIASAKDFVRNKE